MIGVAPDLPWEPERTRGAVRGRVLIRMAPGEAPEGLPHQLEVARGRAAPHLSVDGGPVDAAVRRHSPAMRAMNAFRPADRVGGARRWDDLEEDLGLSRTFRVDVDPEADLVALTSALEELAVVEQVSPFYLSVTPFEDVAAEAKPAGDPWYGHEMVGASEALEFEPGDSTLICAVVDSGIDLHHPELESKLRPGLDTVDLSGEQIPRSMRLVGDFSGVDRVPADVVGHGTACAAIIGARGIEVRPGLGGAVRILPLRALAGARMVGRGALTALGALCDIDLAVKLAVDLGARVLNLSFGTPESALRERDPRPHAAVVEYARRRGCVLVAASGNSGTSVRYYPSCLDGVIAVGSVGPGGKPSGFSTRGDHVDVSAPGEDIPSAGVGGYQRNTGTSFAAPFVAGACALLLARAARYGQPVDGGEVRELLMRTAKPFPKGVDHAGCGAGILDVPAALRALEARLATSPFEAREEEPAVWATPVRETRPTARAP